MTGSPADPGAELPLGLCLPVAGPPGVSDPG
jgi:hypothetical protein